MNTLIRYFFFLLVFASSQVFTSSSVKENMKKVLNDIQDGTFAIEWIAENDEGLHRFEKLRKENSSHPIEKIGKELREMMPFLKDSD